MRGYIELSILRIDLPSHRFAELSRRESLLTADRVNFFRNVSSVSFICAWQRTPKSVPHQRHTSPTTPIAPDTPIIPTAPEYPCGQMKNASSATRLYPQALMEFPGIQNFYERKIKS